MKRWHRNLLRGLSLLFSVVPAFLAAIYYFPIWYEADKFEIVLPAVGVLFFCICSIPLIRWVGQVIKSPSAPFIWTVMWLFLFTVEKIIEQLIIISGIGALGNAIGALLWAASRKGEDK